MDPSIQAILFLMSAAPLALLTAWLVDKFHRR
ncbi:hypothetical protein EV278_11669 [Caulobacter sp. BK020]|nr:hypothetical protein EV278_11669 [Caulobacter sp. BK020]